MNSNRITELLFYYCNNVARTASNVYNNLVQHVHTTVCFLIHIYIPTMTSYLVCHLIIVCLMDHFISTSGNLLLHQTITKMDGHGPNKVCHECLVKKTKATLY